MKNYKLFGKIPIFDLVIVLIIVAVALLSLFVLRTSKSGENIISTETKTIRYTVEFQNLSELIDALPEVGDKVFNNTNNYEIGKVVSSDIKPYAMHSYNEITGEPVATLFEDRVTITVVFEADAIVSNMATEINGTKIGIGKNLTYNMPSLCATGVITNIEEVEA